MERVLDQLSRGARVVIVRLRSLGDCVLTTPAIAILKEARPDLEIGVVADRVWAPVFEGNPAITEILPPEGGAVAAFHPDLCLNYHGGTRSLLMTLRSGARFRAGFSHFRGAWLYNVKIPAAQEILGVQRKVHTAEHLASAMFYLGVPAGDVPPARLFAGDYPATGPYAVFHPIASAPDKTWPAERFLDVAAHVRRKFGLLPVFIGAAGEDLSAFHDHRTISGDSLPKLKALIRGASLFVGNDSGPAHIAAAFQVPLVVVFGSSDPGIWAPWKAPSEVVTAPGDIGSIPASRVIEAVERLGVAA